jgi:glycerol dehydrogenase
MPSAALNQLSVIRKTTMSTHKPYSPQEIFAGGRNDDAPPPRVMLAPHRYVQGAGTIDHLGSYISIIASKNPAVLMTEGGRDRFGRRIEDSLRRGGGDPTTAVFKGECSIEEVERLTREIRNSRHKVDAIVAVGGGKCIDASKCVAFRLGLPLVVCPSIASTDAPCSAVSVMYTTDGVGIGPEFFQNSPALVVVDTQIIADSPLRHFIAGMGDALATFYEARTCFYNASGRNMLGARITIAALAIAELCAKTIYKDAHQAIDSVKRSVVDEAVERVVEANTLLSGIGFESGGLAAAHAIAAGLTVIPAMHQDYLHGELVGIGLIAQLTLEKKADEAKTVACFLAEVGLPATLRHLRLDIEKDAPSLMAAMSAAMKEPFINNEPVETRAEILCEALGEADRLAEEIVLEIGDGPFRNLHAQA